MKKIIFILLSFFCIIICSCKQKVSIYGKWYSDDGCLYSFNENEIIFGKINSISGDYEYDKYTAEYKKKGMKYDITIKSFMTQKITCEILDDNMEMSMFINNKDIKLLRIDNPKYFIKNNMVKAEVHLIDHDSDYNIIRNENRNIEILNTEVTQALYFSVMHINPSYHKKDITDETSDFFWVDIYDENSFYFPVENVSWLDAVIFCNKLSKLCNYQPVYTINGVADESTWKLSDAKYIETNFRANGFRLPEFNELRDIAFGKYNTEKRVDYEGEEYDYYFLYAGDDDPNIVSWNESNSNGKTHEVAKKKSNSIGIYDLSGNVAELTDSKYNNDTTINCIVFDSSFSDYPIPSDMYEHSFGSIPLTKFYSNVGFRVVRTIN